MRNKNIAARYSITPNNAIDSVGGVLITLAKSGVSHHRRVHSLTKEDFFNYTKFRYIWGCVVGKQHYENTIADTNAIDRYMLKCVIVDTNAIDRYMLKCVPEELKTEQMCLEAVQEDGFAIKWVPEKLITSEICLEAVKSNGGVIRFVPIELRTAEICLEAVKTKGWALDYVPEELKTAELCIEAVRQNGQALRYVPETLKTAELCLLAVQEDGFAIEWVPETFKTAQLYLEAVKSEGWTLEWVPETFKTAQLCLEAVKSEGSALRYVPETLKTAELCLEAVKENGYAVYRVPEKLKTEQLCQIAEQGIIAEQEKMQEIKNTSNTARLEIKTESIRVNVYNYYNLFGKYRELFNEYDFPSNTNPRLKEAERFQRNNTAKKILNFMNEFVLRIAKDIVILQKVLLQNNVYSKEEIDEANSKIVDLAGMSDNVNKRYNNLQNNDTFLKKIHSDFNENLNVLNETIEKYNEGKTLKLHGISEANNIFNHENNNFLDDFKNLVKDITRINFLISECFNVYSPKSIFPSNSILEKQQEAASTSKSIKILRNKNLLIERVQEDMGKINQMFENGAQFDETNVNEIKSNINDLAAQVLGIKALTGGCQKNTNIPEDEKQDIAEVWRSLHRHIEDLNTGLYNYNVQHNFLSESSMKLPTVNETMKKQIEISEKL